MEVNVPRSGDYTFTKTDRVGIRSKELGKGLRFLGSQDTPYSVYHRCQQKRYLGKLDQY